MEEKFYLDTSIWIDICEERGNNGENAKELVKKIINYGFIIFYSDVNIIELKKLGFFNQEISNLLNLIKPIRIIHTNKNQIKEARSLSKQRKVPLKDALHAVLARDNELQLVSRDRDFEKLKDITITKTPEELI